MSKYIKGPLLIEGKTKRIYKAIERVYKTIDCSDLCIIESKNAITANDDPKFTREFETKAVAANNTTCNIFQLLKNAGIPVSFKKRLTDTTFLADQCQMIPLEVIGRRYAVGSYLKRNPKYIVDKKQEPHKFKDLCVEFFLKTTGGICIFDSEALITNLEVEDPFIVDPHEELWSLYEPKMPYDNSNAFLNIFDPSKFLDEVVSIKNMTSNIINVFHEIEKVFLEQQIRFIDFKIEFGVNFYGELVVSDVIDNDSWRIVTLDWEDLSKQSFRDGEDLSEVEKKYLRVMEITNKFGM